ncbi:hypothetical protein A6V39_00770 [Candidatus Mycoplasma haematobovis]|uniref:Uncharacterized protein n=1 Tax=Candidatus Mycoplasma haematobovis TaxID=432608 RepID=A0A1A9QEM4_9MOLU|nr:hypothetical protein [Candidatus Mycoplasma haematobovis]OAL10584.1 hypothetical protein A6V39_00770 [Candidatus Mycoplasma haematobovis]
MPSATKIIATVAGVSTVGGGVGLSIHLLNKYPTISTKLTSEGFELASTEQDWTKLSEAHNKLVAPTDKVFKEEGTANKDWKWLKSKCEKALSSEENDQTNYKLARQWCVKETDVNAILGKTKGKFKILSSNTTSADSNSWSEKVQNLNQDTTAISALGLQKTGTKNISFDDLKGKCTSILTTKTTAGDFNDKFELAKKWCFISNTAS